MEQLAHNLLEKYYGISGELKRLNAYASENFLVKSEKDKFVFKIYKDSDNPALIQAENEVLIALNSSNKDYNLPSPIKNKNGEFQASFQEGGVSYLFRLLTFVEGTFLAETETDDDIYSSMGTYLANFDLEMLKLKNPVIESRKFEWNIQQIYLAEENITHIDGAFKQNLVRYFIFQYRENVERKVHKLRHSVIHNDFHEWNILTNGKKVIGHIDFGDMAHGPLIQEVAIALTYAMMEKDDPWPSAKTILKSYHEKLPLYKEEIETLYYFITARLCISLCMSALSRANDPDNEYATISEKPGWNLLEKLLETNPISAKNNFLESCGFEVETENDEGLVKSRHLLLSKAMSLSYSSPIRMTKAAFQYMYDASGRTYLDCANNIFHVGHGHPRVIEAAQRQMAQLNTNTRYLYDQLNSYAENLLSKFDSRLNKIFFVNSGSAASDLALRLSRNYTGVRRTMVMDHGYHGNTTAAIDVSAYKFNGKGGAGKSEHIVIAPIPEEDNKSEVLETLRKDLDSDRPIGTFIAESIVGCGGQVPLSPSYIQGLHQMIRLQGGVCIADEVQVGFGRVGSHFWAYETQGIAPDIVILGKPMGNGHPLAAVVTTKEIAEAFENGMEFFSSFGGNPVSCVIGQAVLDVIEEEGLQQHALETGNYLIAQLNQLKADFNFIADVRGHGLFLGIEFTDENRPASELTTSTVDQLKENGILLGIDGPHHNVIKFKPPMCFDRKNADELVEKLGKAMMR